VSKFPVLDIEGKETGSIELPDEIFAGRVKKDILHQAVVMYQATQRQGTLGVKDKGAVSGGGKKPFRQKGTGRARAGSSRSPLWADGGVVFGPVMRDFGYSIPKKIKTAALRESLAAKFQGKDLVCITDISKSFSKTKEFTKILNNLKLNGKILALLDGSDASIQLVSRNISKFNMQRSADVNAYDVIKSKKLLVTKTAVQKLIDRITK
jgi:large subunit ribosomal protein L4